MQIFRRKLRRWNNNFREKIRKDEQNLLEKLNDIELTQEDKDLELEKFRL
jgi:hypothetical protein